MKKFTITAESRTLSKLIIEEITAESRKEALERFKQKYDAGMFDTCLVTPAKAA